jgi:protein LTV1
MNLLANMTSNTENRPRVIENIRAPTRIRLSKKTGFPVRQPKQMDPIEEDVSDDEDGNENLRCNLGLARNKNESVDEKRMRKQALKESKRTRRASKKLTSETFKKETIRLQTLAIQKKAHATHLE